MSAPSRIVVLTGAGISAESGVDTFRDKDGIWSKVDFREVATPEGFAADPHKVHAFYNHRRAGLTGIEPNAAHFALARLEHEFAGAFLLVTQNIDHLHERAGSERVIHMHGELANALCGNCGDRRLWEGDLSTDTPCPACRSKGFMRPDVVWFGEMPYQMERIYAALADCDLFVAIGTSGTVYPAAGFIEEARAAGAETLELNLEPTEGTSRFSDAMHGKATEIVPAWVDHVLAASG